MSLPTCTLPCAERILCTFDFALGRSLYTVTGQPESIYLACTRPRVLMSDSVFEVLARVRDHHTPARPLRCLPSRVGALFPLIHALRQQQHAHLWGRVSVSGRAPIVGSAASQPHVHRVTYLFACPRTWCSFVLVTHSRFSSAQSPPRSSLNLSTCSGTPAGDSTCEQKV